MILHSHSLYLIKENVITVIITLNDYGLLILKSYLNRNTLIKEEIVNNIFSSNEVKNDETFTKRWTTLKNIEDFLMHHIYERLWR